MDSELEDIGFFIPFNNKYYATGNSQTYGDELWKIDDGSITLLKDFYPGSHCYCTQ